ncbi:hypothetical protein U0070_001353, partial [Myodes glareolus]
DLRLLGGSSPTPIVTSISRLVSLWSLSNAVSSKCSGRFHLLRDAIGFLPVSLAFTPSVLDIPAAWGAQFLFSVLHLTPPVMSQPESWQRLFWKLKVISKKNKGAKNLSNFE